MKKLAINLKCLYFSNAVFENACSFESLYCTHTNMTPDIMEHHFTVLDSYFRIRKTIGVLGLLLPFLLVIVQEEVLASISHYYYGKSSVIFTSVLTAFGLFLISYRGYRKDPVRDKLSDNLLTNTGGIAALLVVAFPTSCSGSNSELVESMVYSGSYPLFGHNDIVCNTIHLLSAGLFLFIMGWMSVFRFTRSNKTENRKENKLYRVAGYVVWASVLMSGLEFLFDFKVSDYDVFVLETTSVVSFGVSWLVKGKILQDLSRWKRKINPPVL
jgi:hypothetical protein